MEKNLDEILQLTEWVNKNKALQNISFLALLETGLVAERQNWFKSQTYKDLWPQDTGKVYRVMDELIRLRKNGYKIWNPISQLEAFKEYYTEPDRFMKETEYRAHDYIIDLDENGSIYLSGDVLGNVRDDDLKQLWFSDKANQIRRKIDSRGPGKRCCVINFICTFPSDEEYQQKPPEQDVCLHQRLGFCYFDQGKIEEAFNEFKQASNLGLENEYVHQGLGSCYQHKKQFDQAVDEFKMALVLNPGNYYAHQGLAYCYESLKQFDLSIGEFNWLLNIHPNNEHYYMGLGCCYEGLRQFDKAIDKFKQALRINPTIECANRCISLCSESLKQQRG